MKLLHRHIFAQVALTSLAAVGVLTFIVALGSVLKDLITPVLAGQLPFTTFVYLIWLTVLYSLCHTLPAGILTGVLLVLGRMSSDREITAIRSAGVSVAGISAPIFFFALLGTGMSLVVNFYYMPNAKVTYEKDLADAVRNNPLSFIVPKTFIRQFPGRIIYVSEKTGEVMKDFWIWELDSQNRVRRFARAQSARVTFDEPNNKLVLTMNQAQIEERDGKDPENFSLLRGALSSERVPFELSLDQLTGRKLRVKPEWLTLNQLLSQWRKLGQPDPAVPLAERQKQRIKLQAVIQEKTAKAFSVLSFALFAIPLGIKVSRKETSANLGIAVALAMAYYISTFGVNLLSNKPEFRPDLLMWLPNLGFQVLGIWMFYKADRS